jgi:flagellar capping protein FliD
LEAKDSLIKSLEARTNDLNDRIRSLEEQLRVKDSQLENKDSQLENQAIYIQTMLTQKAIEAPGSKKPWWRFW